MLLAGCNLTTVNSPPHFDTNIKHLELTAAHTSSQDVPQSHVLVLRRPGVLPFGGDASIHGPLRCRAIGCETSIIELENGESCRDHERKLGLAVRALTHESTDDVHEIDRHRSANPATLLTNCTPECFLGSGILGCSR